MNFDTLVMAGGGTFGLAGVGFLYELFKYNPTIYKNINVMSGCSIGSAIVCMLAMGYTPLELITFVSTEIKIPSLGEISIDRLQKKHGLFNIEDVMDGFYRSMDRKQIDRDITFSEFYQICGKEIVINCFNLTDLQDVVFSTRKTPKDKIVDAIRYSICIPIAFEKQLCNGKIYVDGGLHNNIPVEYIYEPYTYKKRPTNVPDGYKHCIAIDYLQRGQTHDESASNSIIKYALYICSRIYDMSKLKKDKHFTEYVESVTIDCNASNNITEILCMDSATMMKVFCLGSTHFMKHYCKSKKYD